MGLEWNTGAWRLHRDIVGRRIGGIGLQYDYGPGFAEYTERMHSTQYTYVDITSDQETWYLSSIDPFSL